MAPAWFILLMLPLCHGEVPGGGSRMRHGSWGRGVVGSWGRGVVGSWVFDQIFVFVSTAPVFRCQGACEAGSGTKRRVHSANASSMRFTSSRVD